MAAPLAKVDGDTDAFVAVEFDGLDGLFSNGDGLADTFGDIDFAG